MKKPVFFMLCLALLLVGAAPFSLGETLPDFVELAGKLKPAVVNISTSKTVQSRRLLPGPTGPHNDLFDEFFERFFQGVPNRSRKERSLGSGFIISADGYILTNDHVVGGADEITVRLADGRAFRGTVEGIDSKLDLALVKIDIGDEKLPVAVLGESEKLRVGEWVMAIGNPFGLEQTVTVGIVSAKGRVIGAGLYDDFIQTDASINPGNSGGPLFNIRGQVVGINSAIVAGGQGIGFAIPIDAAKAVLPQLRETGHVVRGWLGVTVQTLTRELAASFGLKNTRGALVTEVAAGSPAAKAGIERGDVILAVNGRKLETMNDLPKQVAALPVGRPANVTIFRDGKTREMPVEIGTLDDDRSQPEKEENAEKVFGLTLGDISPEAMRYYGLEGDRGALVTAVEGDGPAAEAGIQPGDLIIEAGGRPTANAAELRAVTAKANSGQGLRLLVQRRDRLFYTVVEPAAG
jgi:serine protease Do